MRLLLSLLLMLASHTLLAEEQSTATATYLGNEAVLIEYEDTKLLFDPFFHNSFDIYQKVPSDMLEAIFKGKPPFNNIDAVFVSHAHGDHFSPEQTLEFLNANPNAKLIAPEQAISQLLTLSEATDLETQIVSISLEYKDPVEEHKFSDFTVDAVRIPHAGWPQRSEVSNLVYRVTLQDEITVIHMGDADPDDAHFKPLKTHWEAKRTQMSFPPYWFYFSDAGQLILDSRLNTEKSVGIHVPVQIPMNLRRLGKDYFSTPGEQRVFGDD